MYCDRNLDQLAKDLMKWLGEHPAEAQRLGSLLREPMLREPKGKRPAASYEKPAEMVAKCLKEDGPQFVEDLSAMLRFHGLPAIAMSFGPRPSGFLDSSRLRQAVGAVSERDPRTRKFKWRLQGQKSPALTAGIYDRAAEVTAKFLAQGFKSPAEISDNLEVFGLPKLQSHGGTLNPTVLRAKVGAKVGSASGGRGKWYWELPQALPQASEEERESDRKEALAEFARKAVSKELMKVMMGYRLKDGERPEYDPALYCTKDTIALARKYVDDAGGLDALSEPARAECAKEFGW